jgi:hypothetical protein
MIIKMKQYYTLNDLLPKECTYCGKDTGNDYSILPNHEYQKSKWHKHCVTRFFLDYIFAEGIQKKDDEYLDKYIKDFICNIREEFPKLIEKANERDEKEKYQYRQVPQLTV